MGEFEVCGLQEATARSAYTMAVIRDLQALERVLDAGLIETGVRRIGAEQELFLVDQQYRPAPVAMKVLERIDDDHFTTELGRFNLEVNLDPLDLGGDCLRRLERDLAARLQTVRRAAYPSGARVYLGGSLPTLRTTDLHIRNMTPRRRYAALNEAMAQARGGPFELHIEGTDELALRHDSVMLEACCTSFHMHLQVGAEEFAHLYNLAHFVSGPVLAAAANSPLLLGRRLWHETRIPLFRQSLDTRTASFHLRERSSRVHFGTDWVDESVLEVFEESMARFRALLTATTDEDPLAVLDAGGVPELRALGIHNGTVYRWNRGCYGVADGVPHLRIEMRALPAGPSVVDEVANAALFYGAVLGLADEVDDVRGAISFAATKANFRGAAESGLGAHLVWLGGRRLGAVALILEELLPRAAAGLQAAGVDAADVDHYLGIVEERVRHQRNGANWLLRSVAWLHDHGRRNEVLTAVTRCSIEHQENGLPVHEWPRAQLTGEDSMDVATLTVEDFMTTDLFTVRPDDPIVLVAYLMDWKHVRHVPVEDEDGKPVGMLSSLEVVRNVVRHRVPVDTPVGEIMLDPPPAVVPGTSIGQAIDMLRQHEADCLPVVDGDRLVGLLTEYDFIYVVASMLRDRDAPQPTSSD